MTHVQLSEHVVSDSRNAPDRKGREGNRKGREGVVLHCMTVTGGGFAASCNAKEDQP